MRPRPTFRYRIRYKDWKNRTRFEFAMCLAEAELKANKLDGTIQRRCGYGRFA